MCEQKAVICQPNLLKLCMQLSKVDLYVKAMRFGLGFRIAMQHDDSRGMHL